MNEVIACDGAIRDIQDLARRFENLWCRVRSPGSDPEPGEPDPFGDISNLLLEPHRHYHGWCHLLDCLKQFDTVRDRLDNPDAVELSLWFHDAIYDPRRGDNEQQSAAWFRALAEECLPQALVKQVSDYILLTRHRQAPADRDGAFVVDIDLSSLGADWGRFEQDSVNLRMESQHLSSRDYNRGKRKFFEALLQRPRIYFTNTFCDRYEACARKNIHRLLGSLESSDASGCHPSRVCGD
jgi:predicted metal-dependent HD superfamily phosphohydrolase